MQNIHPEQPSCPWCGSRNTWGSLECRRCGGPQPATAPADAGPEPPLSPRAIPQGYQRHLLITQVIGLVGFILFMIGLPFLIVFPVVGLSTELYVFFFVGCGVGGLFTGVGGMMLFSGLMQIRRQVKIYRDGVTVKGLVSDVEPNRNLNVKGRNPWKVTYTYQVMGSTFEGVSHTWHPTVDVGSPVHVLYLPGRPDESALYPPINTRKP